MSLGRRSPRQDAGIQSVAVVEPFYTNEDVAILHNIVVLAQELLPTLPDGQRLPTNALFEAYYDVLPRNGLTADHDNRYARVLFKIGGIRGNGTLYEKFEEVLSRMGIDIEYDEVERESDDGNENTFATVEDTEAVAMAQNENVPPRGRPRRNSDSAWDLGPEAPAKPQRRNSYSSYKKAKVPPVRDQQGFLRDVLQLRPSNQFPNETQTLPGSNVGAWLNAKPVPERRQRERSMSRQPSIRVRRRSLSVASGRPAPTATTSHPNSDEYNAESEITAVTSIPESDITDSIDLPPETIHSKSFTSQIEARAEVMLRLQISFMTKQQLRAWRDQALQRQEDRVNLELIAHRHDKNALLFQALDNWHKRYLEKRSIVQTERFFGHLERRSVKARDYYVLHKAFTHWHGSACEEAERTRVARRHILRTRMFNAWRDITAVKELKVRRQVLKKFFGVWQKRCANTHTYNSTAVQKYEGRLVGSVFILWAREMWDIKATKYWSEGLKLRTFSLWTFAAQKSLDGKRTAEEERRLQLAWNAWRVWKAKSGEHINQDQQASTFRQTCLCISTIRKWRSETRVIPAKKALQTEVATRLLRETFATWLHYSRRERQAAAIDRLRILREAWTNWRHKSRLRMVRVRVTHRVIWDSIYKWMLARREKTTKQKLKAKTFRKVLQYWVHRAVEVRYERWEREDLAQQCAMQRTQEHVMMRWVSRSQSQQQLDADAYEFYSSRLLQGSLLRWSAKNLHLRQLQQWSSDAEFYFVTSKTFKRWKAGTEDSKREKRKAAYTQIRRITKINLGKGILLAWHSQAQQILDMQAQAHELVRNKNVLVSIDIFACWRARTRQFEEMQSKWRESVLRKHFESWRDRSIAFQDLKVEAITSFQERQQIRVIKKWELGVLQMRGRSIQATEVHEKNAKRSFRRIFNYWQQKAAERRPFRDVEGSAAVLPAQLGATARTEAWSEFGDEEGEWSRQLEEPIAPNLLPGYLSTPSRRTDRIVAAAARFSSTTPRAPLSTPFERHLRAQYSGGLPSLRRPPGRSTLGLGGGFSDIDSGKIQ